MTENDSSMKNILIGLLVLNIIVSGASLVYLNGISSNTNNLNQKMDEFGTKIGELTSAEEDIVSAITGLAETVGQTGEDIKVIQERLSRLEEAEPTERVVLRLGLDTAYETTDPPIWYSDLLNGIGQLVTEPLFRMIDDPVTGGVEIEPVLVDTWERTDEKTWVFHLKEGVKFSDGTELTAEDVVWSIWGRQEQRPPNFLWSIDERVENMEVVDKYTFKMESITPMPNLHAWLVQGWTNIMSKDAVAASDQLDVYPIQGVENVLGTGPYMWKSMQPMLKAEMTLNPYWRGDPPQITDIVAYYVPEGDARVTALQSDSVDWISQVPLEAISMLEDQGFKIWSRPGTGFLNLAFVNVKPPLDDARVRKALAYAIDYDELLDTIFGGMAVRPKTVVPPADLGAKGFDMYDHDIDKAKELLVEAGLSDGFTIKMAYRSGAFPHVDECTAAIQSYFSDIGVTLDVDILERSTLHEETIVMRNRYLDGEVGVEDINYNLFYGTWLSDTLWAGDDMFSIYRSNSDHNYWYYHNAEVDDLINIAVSQAPIEERIAAIEDAQQIMMEECAMAPFYTAPYITASTPDLVGYKTLPNVYEYFQEARLIR